MNGMKLFSDHNVQFSDVPKHTRTYYYGKRDLVLHGVVGVYCCRENGNIALKLADDSECIIPPGWMAVTATTWKNADR